MSEVIDDWCEQLAKLKPHIDLAKRDGQDVQVVLSAKAGRVDLPPKITITGRRDDGVKR